MKPRIILAGGGTAGHIEPALAVAEHLIELEPTAACVFLGTKAGLERTLVPERGFQLFTIAKVAFPRKISWDLLFFPGKLFLSIWQSIKVMKGSDLLVGFGGYVSASAYLAAILLRMPIVIHEANAKPGWANRLGRLFAKTVAVNFDEVRKIWPSAVVTGMPIRSSITHLPSPASEARAKFRERNLESWGFNPSLPVIAVFGGSQGSVHINLVLEEFLQKNREARYQIIHAVGMNNPLPLSAPGYLPLPYFHDMAAIYGSSDLLISRSGAVTCAELTQVGCFSILVPLPHGNGEQISNAEILVERGIATMVRNEMFTAQWLENNLESALDSSRLMGRRLFADHQNAARRIAGLCLAELRLAEMRRNA